MIMALETVAVKKGTGIESIVDFINPAEIEEPGPLPRLALPASLMRLLEQYEHFMHETPLSIRGDISDGLKDELTLRRYFSKHQLMYPDAVFTPAEIDHFLTLTKGYKEEEQYRALTGIFITRIIKNSYNSGNNYFHLVQ